MRALDTSFFFYFFYKRNMNVKKVCIAFLAAFDNT